MYKSFLIKYAEIAIKGKNRYLFEDALVSQINHALKKAEGEFLVRKEQGRIYVDTLSDYEYDEVVEALKCVFGIVGIHRGDRCGHPRRDLEPRGLGTISEREGTRLCRHSRRRASGGGILMTDYASIHQPVLLEQCVSLVAPALQDPGSIAVDCTLGLAGHTIAFLKAAPQARVLGIDRDAEALAMATERIAG